MFWIKLEYIFRVYCLLLILLVWLIVLCLLFSKYREDKLEENRKYDINHKTIKDIKVRNYKHHGKISFESEEGQGASFTFTIPITK